ncbi:carbon monoxide dehydrogenase subunit G [Rubrobacter xylanophilus DSM 9941]|uniref:Carbon monoxide dehydrogenase subunit G n=1 Tax=Rubrobacter xylanophilus (strain DSM 9941 / JCM 11954 / NBRC 16129 / PRD-1) TaxID=266117 RepID=Q1AUW3_RUBXD|nr:SRPBCC family protein [Rubrobacter xylanophilus]ABG04815.1 carbon monoxide dehydrogenase subunit G [Rubrobacter xylanophilus DSM 9941]
MRIQNQIEVAAPPDELFDILADVERVAPLLPGATLEGKEDDDTYAGTVKVKVGPITTSYRGTIRFQELDHDARRAVMRASGREVNGQGGTEATITATVSGSDSKSVLRMDTDLEVRGKVAQFGRGAIGNVSQRILDQFARNLESQVLSGEGREEEAPRPSEETTPTGKPESGEAPPSRTTATAPVGERSLDMLSVIGAPMLRQAAPVAIGLALGLLIGSFISSRKTLRAYQETMKLLHYGPGYEAQRWGRNLPK